MKYLFIFMTAILTFNASADIEIGKKYRGFGKDDIREGWGSQEKECWVEIKRVSESGEIRIKSSYDSWFANGTYFTESDRSQLLKDNAVVAYTMEDGEKITARVELDDEGNILYYTKHKSTPSALFGSYNLDSFCNIQGIE